MQFSTIPATKQITALLASVFTLGLLAMISLVVLAIIGLALAILYILNLACTAMHDLVLSLAALYAGSDAAIKLLIIVLVCWLAWKASLYIVCSLRASLK